jgi:DNA polymerase/3'-5' exonuclease PolX
MSAGRRLPRVEAQVIAEELVGLLRPATIRLEVAGSIRRKRAEVGDLDIVAIPRLHARVVQDLFGQEVIEGDQVDELNERCNALVADGALAPVRNAKGNPAAWGPQLKRAEYHGLPVDILATSWDCWGVAMLLKTGPWEFSKRLVTARSQGGACPRELKFQQSRVWRVGVAEPLATPDEEAVFAALGLEYLPPERRFNESWPRPARRSA